MTSSITSLEAWHFRFTVNCVTHISKKINQFHRFENKLCYLVPFAAVLKVQLTFPCRCKSALVRPLPRKRTIQGHIDPSPTSSAFCRRLFRKCSMADSQSISRNATYSGSSVSLVPPVSLDRNSCSLQKILYRMSIE